MNYQGYSNYKDVPPYYGKEYKAQYDRGCGVQPITDKNLTVQDIYRTPFLFLQEHHKNYKNMAPAALKGVQLENKLSNVFFSDENFRRVQKMIKDEVFRRTNGEFRIDVDQEQKDLFIAMKAVYMEQGRFLPDQIVRQVKRLNQKVVSDVVPGMITEVRQYYGYLKEINKPITPIQRPTCMNSKGRRSLPSVTTVWE